MKFRKKPVVVEAMPARDLIEAFERGWAVLPPWAAEAYEQGIIVAITRDGFTIKTMEGDHFARPDDMVVRGVHGELYPCKPDIFAKTYEAAE